MPSESQIAVRARCDLIARMPRPRPLRRSPIASFLAVLITTLLKLAALAFLANLLWSLRTFTSLPEFFAAHRSSFFALMFTGLGTLVVTLAQRQQKNLVANGEVAVGTVSGRYYLNPYWHVNYQFEDNHGRPVTGEAMDKTDKQFLTHGEAMLVYYRSENPGKSIAQCESWYEPAGEGIEPDPRFR